MGEFAKHPSEFYGKLVTLSTKNSLRPYLEAQQCPFLGKKCIKVRKSNQQQTIGSCTLGYQGAPLVVCPQRFLQRYQIFLDSVRLLMPMMQYFIVPEISMPGGHVDYFLVAKDGDSIVDYAGIEIQALDTTGSGGIWDARQDLMQGRLRDSYTYGINWKMSAKTILVQMHHKATAFEALGRKLVLVIQRQFFDYLSNEFQTSLLRSADTRDSVQFHVYDCVLFGHELQIVLNERKSTDIRGIERMLNLGRTTDILEEDVIRRIRAKFDAAHRLDVSTAVGTESVPPLEKLPGPDNG